jgi:hypothetical protein
VQVNTEYRMGKLNLISENKTAVLSTAYMGHIQYFTKFILHKKVLIEQYETYLKQSYRNRCYINGTNGILPLIIPVKKAGGNTTKTKDILIDYDTNWQRIHWNSIVSAYSSSPFFEFYEDDFIDFYTAREKFLLDLNNKLLALILDFLEIDCEIKLTETFIKSYDREEDYRKMLNPKKRLMKPDIRFIPHKYNQVFIEKHGFAENLSIIDLLFNEGANARQILIQSIK